MQRVSGANNLPNGNGVGKAAYQDYNPATGQAGTTPNSSALNSLQEEIASFIEAMGITLDPTDNTQLAAALTLFVAAAVGGSVTTGQMNTAIATALVGYAKLVSPSFTGVPVAPTAALGTSTTQIATTAFANPGASLAPQGYERRPSGKIRVWTTFTYSISSHGTVTVTWPVALPSEVTDCGITAFGVNSGGGAVAGGFSTAPSLTGGTIIIDCFNSGVTASGTGIAWAEGN